MNELVLFLIGLLTWTCWFISGMMVKEVGYYNRILELREKDRICRINGYWTLNRRKWAECNDSEKKELRKFFCGEK